ncbi:hypothetical protein [Actinokineospora fastidiosa]|uniref:hypothetical protein n=1 Tax=Actinokineospora fastidiosa TaxID=1816 RepID=UPI0016704463|nr:hypothetical protein [Actinokineospora fastidiosa]
MAAERTLPLQRCGTARHDRSHITPTPVPRWGDYPCRQRERFLDKISDVLAIETNSHMKRFLDSELLHRAEQNSVHNMHFLFG